MKKSIIKRHIRKPKLKKLSKAITHWEKRNKLKLENILYYRIVNIQHINGT